MPIDLSGACVCSNRLYDSCPFYNYPVSSVSSSAEKCFYLNLLVDDLCETAKRDILNTPGFFAMNGLLYYPIYVFRYEVYEYQVVAIISPA